MSITIGTIAFIILASTTITNCVSLYVSVRYLERIEGLLPNSTFISGNQKIFQQAGLMGKVIRTLLISILLTIPKVYTRRGLADPEEIRKFPTKLKNKLILLGIIHPILLGCLILLWVWLVILYPDRF